MGWRYLLFALGGLTVLLWIIRFFASNLSESPRFLIGVGKDEEAVAVIHKIAAYNSKTTSLTVDELTRAGNISADTKGPDKKSRGMMSQTSAFTTKHVKALFATRKMAYSTSLLILMWCRYFSLVCTSFELIIICDRYCWSCNNFIRQFPAFSVGRSTFSLFQFADFHKAREPWGPFRRRIFVYYIS